MMREGLGNEDRLTQFQLRLRRSTFDRIEEISEKQGISRAKVIREILDTALEPDKDNSWREEIKG